MVLKDLKAGLPVALISVALISTAQLTMKWGMGQLSFHWTELQSLLIEHQFIMAMSLTWPALVCVGVGLGCYALSMACWVMALKHLPLGVAYPLLSLSYVLVYVLAVTLPWLDETFSWAKFSGIGFILLGLTLIFTAKKSSA
ncbi:4-amino-4-deoxy-L-arabinose-phosphoundecaprenol flippase subunit ArnF [Vibrio hangzhouensis]|uniref:4-amino-4-deoxy-L-arabinose-phosphoundecaprenol flippase subunit ArnF n=1 Tax=Vibrio hangzhouensis TaxID=462991 RepID=UPI001C968F7A|nr:4-amino-4-deoxy-L-arabinose-phosphoundecaprenol flippase subunit ArnF [Vibrio hangzhouensis]MBY6197891.1 4-amino-4-deoxy-L-arabinose-phospho-UDP flippase [Vibrio hangzhouensis]